MLELHPRTALRPEPFGALAYHYDHRTLMFLRHPDLLDVLRRLDGRRTVQEVLEATGVARSSWPAFDAALARLLDSQLVVQPSLRSKATQAVVGRSLAGAQSLASSDGGG